MKEETYRRADNLRSEIYQQKNILKTLKEWIERITKNDEDSIPSYSFFDDGFTPGSSKWIKVHINKDRFLLLLQIQLQETLNIIEHLELAFEELQDSTPIEGTPIEEDEE